MTRPITFPKTGHTTWTNRASLEAAVERAMASYRRARGTRQDSGRRIESAREAKARQRLSAQRVALADFNREHPADS